MTFDDLKQEVSEGISIVDFWAEWCGPCHTQSPILDTLKNVKILKVNIEEEGNKEIAAHFGIRSIPTLHLYKNGEPREAFVGVQTQLVLQEKINYLINEQDAEFTEGETPAE